jgi:hypothetical protein
VQRDARAVGFGQDEPGARGGNRAAPFVEARHQLGLDGNQLRFSIFFEQLSYGLHQRAVDGACQARRAARRLARAQRPGPGALAVDLDEVVAQVRILFRRAAERAAPRHHRVAHEAVGEHHRHLRREIKLDALQRGHRALPGLGAERRVAGDALLAERFALWKGSFPENKNLRREKPDAQPVRKQT